jgi:ABC-type bacteriocin/lantibiotic exporter with double-glycine peptidase domain
MIKRIRQRKWEDGDCGVPCVAMIAEKSYDEIDRIFVKKGYVKSNGAYFTKHNHLISLLDQLGFIGQRRSFRSWKETPCPSIIKINKRKGNFWHWVVLIERNGRPVMLDPNPKAPDTIFDFRGKKGTGQYIYVSKKC